MSFLVIVTFLSIFFVTMCCVGIGLAYHESRQRKLFMQMLRTVEAGNTPPVKQMLRAQTGQSPSSKWLKSLPMMASLNQILRQSGMTWSAEKLVGMSAGGCALGAVIGMKLDLLSMTTLSTSVFAAIGGFGPFLFVSRKRNKNIKAFESQFPEALDFLARCLRRVTVSEQGSRCSRRSRPIR